MNPVATLRAAAQVVAKAMGVFGLDIALERAISETAFDGCLDTASRAAQLIEQTVTLWSNGKSIPVAASSCEQRL